MQSVISNKFTIQEPKLEANMKAKYCIEELSNKNVLPDDNAAYALIKEC